MTIFSNREIVLFTLISSLVLISFPLAVYGEEISVTSIAFEETSILELTNNSKDEVNTLRIWVGSDFSFTSFKTEQGWIGEKTPNGVIVFTSSETIKPGESVKFGVKTDKSTLKINWKALDSNNEQISTGATIAKDIPAVVKNSAVSIPKNTGVGVSTESEFRIIPDKPNIGSTIRVTGDNFGSSQEYGFYIDSKKLGTFETDENGHFMTTMKIPDDQKAQRVDLKVIDKDGKEKTISLRIGEVKNRIPKSDIVPLTIQGISDIMHRGDILEISGTGEPHSAIIAQINTPSGSTINSRTAEIDAKGNWSLTEPITVPLDAEFGRYSATISDGREDIVKYWTVESDKVIHIAPTQIMFNAGELIIFNGTALPDIPIEFVLEDSLGNEMASDLIEVNNTGIVEFSYQTTQNVDKEGTWTLFATQQQHQELIYVGYDEVPTIPVNIKFDKLNYKNSETAHITITGDSSEKLSMIIISPSGSIEGKAITIQLESDGKIEHDLKLTGFDSGIYNAVIKKGTAQTSEMFTVGLQVGAGEIQASTTKLSYFVGDSILILGNANEDVLLTATLFDPTGREIKSVEFPSDDTGKFTENRLRIPSYGSSGPWMIKVSSGPNFFDINFDVSTTQDEGMKVTIEKGQEMPGFGTIIKIKVEGAAPKSSVFMEISNEQGTIIDDSLKCNSTSSSTCDVPWTITNDLVPGTYTVKITDGINDTKSTFIVD
jgi:hypothetical protein